MVQYTAPDNLPVYGPTDVMAPLEDRLGDLATAIQIALLRSGTVGSATARDNAIPNPVAGMTVWRSDTNCREVYLPQGPVRTAGWYPVEGALPGVYAKSSAAMTSVATSTPTPLKFTAVDLQRNITYDLSTGRATIVQSGLYMITGSARPGTVSANNRLYITVNSESTPAIQQMPTNDIGAVSVQLVRPLTAGDVVSIDFFTNTSQTVNVGQRSIGLTYLGPA